MSSPDICELVVAALVARARVSLSNDGCRKENRPHPDGGCASVDEGITTAETELNRMAHVRNEVVFFMARVL